MSRDCSSVGVRRVMRPAFTAASTSPRATRGLDHLMREPSGYRLNIHSPWEAETLLRRTPAPPYGCGAARVGQPDAASGSSSRHLAGLGIAPDNDIRSAVVLLVLASCADVQFVRCGGEGSGSVDRRRPRLPTGGARGAT